MKTAYTNLYEITEIQKSIVRYIDYWVHAVKTPVPQSDIMKEFEARGRSVRTVRAALDGLLRLGYIRRSETISNKTSYVQLRRLS